MVEIIPSVTLHRGKVVKGRGREVVSRTPVEYLQGIIKSYEKVFILDMDGVLRRKPNWAVLKKLEGKDVWLDIGVKRFDGIFDPFLIGMNKVVLSTVALRDFKEIVEAFKLSENVMMRIELNTDTDKVRGDAFQLPLRDLLSRLNGIGIKELIYSGKPSSFPLGERSVERILALRSGDFEVYVALPGGFDKTRMEGAGIKGIITDAVEVE